MRSIKDSMADALNSEYGLAFYTGSYEEALLLRRRFYSARETMRRQGDQQFDGLSFIANHAGELLVIKRADHTLSPADAINYRVRSLTRNELPDKIGVRGSQRMSLLTQQALNMMTSFRD